MDNKKFEELLEELKQCEPRCDYWLALYYQGVEVGCIYGEGVFYDIEIDDRDGYVLVHSDTFGILVDEAIIKSL